MYRRKNFLHKDLFLDYLKTYSRDHNFKKQINVKVSLIFHDFFLISHL
jgi:hypothetical protein